MRLRQPHQGRGGKLAGALQGRGREPSGLALASPSTKPGSHPWNRRRSRWSSLETRNSYRWCFKGKATPRPVQSTTTTYCQALLHQGPARRSHHEAMALGPRGRLYQLVASSSWCSVQQRASAHPSSLKDDSTATPTSP
jgi:hypothetical protein